MHKESKEMVIEWETGERFPGRFMEELQMGEKHATTMWQYFVSRHISWLEQRRLAKRELLSGTF